MADMKMYRLAKGLTQKDIAKRLNVSVTTVCRWEGGQMPEPRNVPLLAKLLGIEPLHLTQILAREKAEAELVEQS